MMNSAISFPKVMHHLRHDSGYQSDDFDIYNRCCTCLKLSLDYPEFCHFLFCKLLPR